MAILVRFSSRTHQSTGIRLLAKPRFPYTPTSLVRPRQLVVQSGQAAPSPFSPYKPPPASPSRLHRPFRLSSKEHRPRGDSTRAISFTTSCWIELCPSAPKGQHRPEHTLLIASGTDIHDDSNLAMSTRLGKARATTIDDEEEMRIKIGISLGLFFVSLFGVFPLRCCLTPVLRDPRVKLSRFPQSRNE